MRPCDPRSSASTGSGSRARRASNSNFPPIVSSSRSCAVRSVLARSTRSLLPSSIGSLRATTWRSITWSVIASSGTAAPSRDGDSGILYRVIGYQAQMAALYAAADLLITRAGAGTLAEVATVGAPAIVVPWPDAAENHQLANAKLLADQDAVLLIEQVAFTPERLIAEIDRFIERARPNWRSWRRPPAPPVRFTAVANLSRSSRRSPSDEHLRPVAAARSFM